MGSVAPAKRSSTYGSSSKTRKSYSRASCQEPVALLARERVAGRVLEVGDDVRELRAQAALEQLRQRVDVDPVGLEVDRHDLGAALAQAEQRPVVRRALHDDRVPGLDERVEEERVGLHRPVRDDDLRHVDAVLLGDPRAQRHVADGGAVRGRARRVLLEGLPCSLAEPVEVDDVRGRRAAREGDEVGRGHEPVETSASPRGSRRRGARPRSACGRPSRPSPPAPRPSRRPCPASRR